MATPSKNLLPSPMDFPDTITPVTAAKLPEIHEAFGLKDGRRYSAEIRYERMSSRIAGWTGHEHTEDRHGHPFSRAEWLESIHKSLSYLNTELVLGFDKQMIEVLTLCYGALQESPRYSGDAVIEAKKGENTAVHSLHTMLQAFRVYQKALDAKPELANNIDFFKSFQRTCLMMAVHDLGEMLGEAGSLAQVANTGNWGVKDKAAYERMVFNFGVRLAIKTVIDKQGTEADFFKKIDSIRMASNIQNQGASKSDQQMVTEVGAHLGDEIHLSARGRKLFQFIYNAWECVEEPQHSDNPYLGYLAAICERVQGTRHINRMLVTSKSPHDLGNGQMGMIMTHKLSPGYRMFTNADYSEGHLGWLNHYTDPQSPYEKVLAQQAIAWSYETVRNFYAMGPEAFYIDPALQAKDLKLHDDGSAFTPDEVKIRLSQIETAKKIALLERGDISNQLQQPSLCDTFSAAVIPFGAQAVLRDDIVRMYDKAIEQKFMPGIQNESGQPLLNGKGQPRGMILVRDRPAALVEFSQDNIKSYAPKTIKQIAALTAK